MRERRENRKKKKTIGKNGAAVDTMGLLVAILPMKKVTNVSHSFLLAKTANNKDAKPRTGLVLTL